MKFILKLIVKIIAVPFVVALTILNALMYFMLFLSGSLLSIASFFTGIAGAGMLITGNTYTGVGLLVMAFLVSPFGLPAIAGWLADKVADLNYSLKGFIVG